MSLRVLFAGVLPRILRQKWGARIPLGDGTEKDTGVQMFAEEIAAILSSEAPIELNSPVLFKQNFEGAPFQFFNDGDTNPREFVFDDDLPPEVTDPSPDDPGPAEIFVGQIVAKVRPSSVPKDQTSFSSTNYTVDLYTRNPDPYSTSSTATTPSLRATVQQLFIDPLELIPAETWTLVARLKDGTYHMQVPVWL